MRTPGQEHHMPFRKTLLVAAGVIGLATSAQASVILTLNNVTAAGGGNWNFNYSATLAADEQIAGGSFFTIYDFGPTVVPAPTSTRGSTVNGVDYLSPANFTWTKHLTDTPATGVAGLPPDNPSVLNVRATYSGALGAVNGFDLGNGQEDNLGDFT